MSAHLGARRAGAGRGWSAAWAVTAFALVGLVGCGGGRPGAAADLPDRTAQAVSATGAAPVMLTLAGAPAQSSITAAGTYALRLVADPTRYLWVPTTGSGLPIATITLQAGAPIPREAQFAASAPVARGLQGQYQGCLTLRAEAVADLPWTLPATPSWPAATAALPQSRFLVGAVDPTSTAVDYPVWLRATSGTVTSPTELCQRPGLGSRGTRFFVIARGENLKLSADRLTLSRDDGSTAFDAAATWEVVKLANPTGALPALTLRGQVPSARYVYGEAGAVLMDLVDFDQQVREVELYNGFARFSVSAAQPFDVLKRLPVGSYRWVARGRNVFTGLSVTTGALDTEVLPLPPPAGYAPPQATLTAPGAATGGPSVAGQAITLLAAPTGATDKVRGIEFLDGARVLAGTTRLPARWDWVGEPGDHQLAVRVTDVYGNQRTSPALAWRVAPRPAGSPALATLVLQPLAAGASAPEGTVHRLTAELSDPAGQIVQVLFYQGADLIGGSVQAPYSVPWNGPVGRHLLTAVAVDRQGRRSASAAVPIEVTIGVPPPPSVTLHPMFFEGLASVQAPATDSRSPAGQDLTINLQYFSKLNEPLSRVELYAVDLGRLTSDVLGPLEFIGSAPASLTSAQASIVWRAPRPGQYALLPRVVAAHARGTSRLPGAVFAEGSAARLTVLAVAQAHRITVGTPVTGSARLSAPSASTGTALELGQGLVLSAAVAGQDGTAASVSQVRFLVDDRVIASLGSGQPPQARWLPQALGRYRLNVEAVDRASGQVFGSAPVVVEVVPLGTPAPITGTDFRAPRVRLLSPLDGTTVAAGARLVVEAQAVDPDGFITSVRFRSDRGDVTITQPPYRLEWTASGSSATVWAEATDDRGLTSFTPTAKVSVTPPAPNQPPTARMAVPATATQVALGTRFTLEAQVADADGRVVKVEFLDNGRIMGTATTAPWRLSGTAGLVGAHALAARATDDRGAVTTSLPVLVQVLPAAP